MSRPRKPDGERKVTRSVYVTPRVVEVIEGRYGTLSACLEAVALGS